MVLAAAIIATLAACFVVAAFPYSGPWPFFKRWIAVSVILAGLLAGGAALGAITRNAWCQGLWICD